MNRRGGTAGGRGRRRRTFTWTAGVSALLYWEQAALLYLLSTLAMCALLLVVAFSDLEGKEVELNESAHERVAPGGGAPSPEALPPSAGTQQVGKRGERV
ncbi:MAG TPA: hypothetical protein VN256_20990 [Pyrinomonadaceae bacterium]|nr:hypothetical protein [Pyrinomonadaceae bacterium]